jgi:hypothetical protein
VALNIGPFTGQSLPFVVPVADTETGEPITDPQDVQIWLEGPDGEVIEEKDLFGGGVEYLGEGRFRAVFETPHAGMHTTRCLVTGPDGLENGSKFEFEVYAF